MLFNAVLITAVPAYDAYEVLVDDAFFTGTRGDVLKINMTQFPDQLGTTMPYNTSWPADWPGSLLLQQSLQTLQKDPSRWTNISRAACKSRYLSGVFSEFRNVVLVTNWTQNSPSDNSVLAVAAMPGFPPYDVSNRFISLCPDAYVAITPNASRPTSATYMEKDCLQSDGTDCKPKVFTNPGGAFTPPTPIFFEPGSANQKAHDMCYSYRPQNGPYNYTQQLSLSYCLSEPMDTTSRIVWSKYISGIVVIALIIKAVAMLISGVCLQFDTKFARRFPWETITQREFDIWSYALIMIAIIVAAAVLHTNGIESFRKGSSPTHSADKNFMIGILIYQNCLHVLLVIRQFIEENFYQKRIGIRKNRPIRFIPINSFDISFFGWNLLSHMFVAFWSGVVMIDRHPLGSAAEDAPKASSTPTMIPSSVSDESRFGRLWQAIFVFPLLLAFHCGVVLWTVWRKSK